MSCSSYGTSIVHEYDNCGGSGSGVQYITAGSNITITGTTTQPIIS